MLDFSKKQFPKFVFSKQYIIVFALIIIFLIAAIYTYRRYVSPRIKPSYVANKEYVQGDAPTTEAVDIYYFYTTWCPHCKKSMPVWQNLKNEIGDKKIKGTRINFLEVDCEKDTELADKFNVKSYPTIKLVKGNQIIEYDAKPNKDTLMEFLNTAL
jgi:thiol-disulfide isomerase/thioredoxin